MLVHNVVETLLIFSIIKLGSSLLCYQCVGSSCNVDTEEMGTCNSDDFCYLTKTNQGETRGCEATEGCSVSRARGGGQFQHYMNINGNECRICNHRLCNGGPQMGPQIVSCYKCEGDECKGDEENISTCESSICFLAKIDGVEKRGCGARPYVSGASSAFQFTCTYDKCNSDQKYEQTQQSAKALQEQMTNLGNNLREDQMRMQQKINEHMNNFGQTMKEHMTNMFANTHW